MLPIIEFLGGCIILAIGANQFLESSIAIAKRFQLPAVIIGVVLVGFGTSFAEVAVAAVAAVHGESLLAIGNVLGSNVANIGLVIGIAAMICPLYVSSRFIRREFPVLVLVTIVAGLLMWNGYLSRLDGVILLLILIIHLIFLFYFGPKDSTLQHEIKIQDNTIMQQSMNFNKALWMWPLGLIYLFISSELIVNGATQIATLLHMSRMLIGLTIVAIGTSLPELATIVLSALKKQHDVAVGTIVGSNIFNLLAVLAMPALITPTALPARFMHIDYPLLLGFTLLFYCVAIWPRKRSDISRLEGLLCVVSYIAYIILIIYLD